MAPCCRWAGIKIVCNQTPCVEPLEKHSMKEEIQAEVSSKPKKDANPPGEENCR